MCGILGQISINQNLLNTNKFEFKKCLSYLNHRGPDDGGVYFDKKISFGHKRLSILDLSKKGKQPMFSKDQKHIIIYNGEIYNFKDLRRSLKNKGFSFNSQTDTEVLLKGLISEGPNFVKKCNGMFAFAYYDVDKDIGYIFRDRIGIKPLFYCNYKNKLTFSSNIKSIHKFNKIKKKINKQAVSSFLSFRQPINNETFFENIFSLEPGNYIEIKNKKMKIKSYWKLENFYNKKKTELTLNNYKNKLKELLNSSVKYRLISDVKVASLLSGGLDSTIISSIINDINKENFLAYSIGYNESGYNEFEYSKLAAKKLNMKHQIIKSNYIRYFKDMKTLIKLRDQPLTIPNEVTQYQLCKKIKKKATVVLSGCGADELFCGYGRIFTSVEDFDQLKKKNQKFLNEQFLDNVRLRYGKLNFKNELDHFLSIYPYTKIDLKKKLLNSTFNHFEIEKNIKNYFQSIFKRINSKRYIDQMQYFFQKYHLKGILEREDISSMAAGVELRVPFLDHRIIQYSTQIPYHYKIKKIKKSLNLTSDKTSEVLDINKYILKEIFKNKIPSKIIKRKKVGFPVPLHKWIENRYVKKLIFQTLLSKKSKKRGIFNIQYIEELLNKKKLNQFKGDSRVYQNSIAAKIWMCFNLECFFLNQDSK